MIVKYFAFIYIWFYYNWSQLFTIHNLNYSLQITTNLNHVIVSLLDTQYCVYLFPPLCHDVFCVSQCTILADQGLKIELSRDGFLSSLYQHCKKKLHFQEIQGVFLDQNHLLCKVTIE
jgi:hypothetical protein